MVVGRQAHAAAPPSMPPASKAKDYSMDRPCEVQNELDELRNRGIAKVLNKHFTATTKKLAKDKAEADAALADLARRRANTSVFVPSKGGDLNPFDSLYVELQNKRAECRRKEKETMLLYQRYVHKYGKSAVEAAAATAKSAVPRKEELTPTSKCIATIPETPPPPSPVPKPPLQPLDENSESVVSEDVTFSRFYNRQIAGRVKDPPTDRSVEKDDPPTLDRTDETDSSRELDLPELQALTPQTSNDTASFVEPPGHEVIPLPANATPAGKKPAEESSRSKSDPPAVKFAFPDEKDKITEDEDPSDEEKDPGAVTAPPGAKGVERHESGSDVSDNLPTKEVTTEFPSVTATADEEDDDRSIISGLTTVNSAMTRQVMEELAGEMEEFIKTETEDIRRMLDAEDYNSSFGQSSTSIMGDESVQVTLKAEAMAREMQQILDDYAKDDQSSYAGTALLDDEDTEATSSYPRPYKTSNPDEAWVVHYDETYEREYYYETNTNQTQWDPPSSGGQSRSVPQMMSADVMPETHAVSGSTRRRSRKQVYKRKLRKRRTRRLVAFGLLAVIAGGSVVHWKVNHAGKSYQDAMEHTAMQSRQILKDQFEYTFTDRKAREEEEAKLGAARMAQLEKERKAKLEAEKRAKLEAERAAAEAERKLQEKLAKERKEKEAEEKKERKEREARLKAEEEAKQRTLEMQKAQTQKLAEEERWALDRPWGCNLPLSYIVHPRCRRLASLNPMYDESDLVNNFLQ